jgi:NAD+ synthetase
MALDPEHTYRVCVGGLREFAEQNQFDECVIGLSGGIDSSVVACLAVDVFGAQKVHGYMLPGPYSSESSLTDAQRLALNLGLKTVRISIVPAYKAFSQALSQVCGGFGGVAAENTQARCRMVILMALANSFGCFLVNTGNKSEAEMGYSTLYGDTAGAYAPIGGLYKTDVYGLARWINDEAQSLGKRPPIPENVLVKPPSAELSAGQRDEDALGNYEDLDRLLVEYVDHGKSPERLVAEGFDASEVERVTKRVDAYEFKRALEPPFPFVVY